MFQETVEDKLASALECHSNIAVLAYGQTGTGKTYTMGTQSSEHEEGIIHKTLNKILNHPNSSGKSVKISFYEIYKDEIFDLLKSQGRKIPLR